MNQKFSEDRHGLHSLQEVVPSNIIFLDFYES